MGLSTKQCTWALINMSLFDFSLRFHQGLQPSFFAFTILNFTLCPVPSLAAIFLTGRVLTFSYISYVYRLWVSSPVNSFTFSNR